jgi:hypothetical protein
MPMQSWQSLLVSQQSDGTALNTSTTETSILTTQAKIILPANFLVYGGQTLRIRAMGRISTLTAAPGTLTFRVKFNATPIAVATSGALALNTTAKTNVTWILDWDLTTRTVGGGTSAAFMFSGQWQSEAVIASPAAGAGGAASHIFPATAPAVGTGFDSTVANLVDLTAQWSVSSASNSVQCHTYKLESLN